ncbi:uncharacterized protein BJ171DRAFT_513158 [Polychytrium aggregatum]|uniref:uncharacterized protein n=1 Tax=Polychytrium aggregatum TaxID=110093 RepID=UPI0022FF0729|nr:uncharacterized protein BJ171DRAFT_513158 [Polychytrium aggregatum]KAI9202771.1 hypothetical protein BJ171DRAFT_513158 [Polychytrium aggregatum]
MASMASMACSSRPVSSCLVLLFRLLVSACRSRPGPCRFRIIRRRPRHHRLVLGARGIAPGLHQPKCIVLASCAAVSQGSPPISTGCPVFHFGNAVFCFWLLISCC